MIRLNLLFDDSLCFVIQWSDERLNRGTIKMLSLQGRVGTT